MSGGARILTSNLAELARRTAVSASPIIEGTVTSRNPDGSLNVDDGKGGCVRMAPKANVRVGQKIKLGTEPALGQQTNLPLVSVSVDPSTVPCPDDQRPECEELIGVPCPTPIPLTFAAAADSFEIAFRDTPDTDAWPSRDGSWANRLGGGELDAPPDDGALFAITAGFGGGITVGQTMARRTTSFTSHGAGDNPYADQIRIVSERMFLSFTTSNLPHGARITSARVRIPLLGSDDVRIHTDHNDSLVVVPSTHDGNHANTDNYFALVPGVILGEAVITDIAAAGLPATPFTYDIELDPDLAAEYLNFGGITRLAILMRLDAVADSVLPAINLFSTGLEVTASTDPDDEVHVAAGDYKIDGTTYSSDGGDFAFNQKDANGHTLTGSDSYQGAVVQQAGGGIVLVKGARNGGRPVAPHGGIIITYVHIGCSHNNPSLISNGDIVFEPAARPFVNVGNPNEQLESYDRIIFNSFQANTRLLIEYELGGSLA